MPSLCRRRPSPPSSSRSAGLPAGRRRAAGTMAAVTLRHGGFRGRIVAVDPIADEPVDRTQLSKKVLSGEMPLEKVRIDASKS